MVIYANSDSYGVMSTTDLRYPELLARLMDVPVLNRGQSGSCNRRIFRTATRDLLQLKNVSLVVICLAPLTRGEWWNPQRPSLDNDGHFESFQIHNPDLKNSPCAQYAEQWYRLYDDEAEETNLFSELVLFTGWLRSQELKYLIFSGNNATIKKIAPEDVFIKEFYHAWKNDPGVLNLYDFSFTKHCLETGHRPFDHDRYGDYGHHAEPAHQEFAEYLLGLYERRY